MNSKLIILATAAASLACAQELRHTREPANLQHVQLDISTDEPQAVGGGVSAVRSDQVFVMNGPGPLVATQFLHSKAMKGAPYSAEAVTESVQVLADGNRITSKQSTKQYRDSEGRTRTETTIAANAMWVPENKSMTFVNIMDPVSGESYTLNSAEKVATKMSMPKAGTMSAGKAMMRTHEASTTVHFEAGSAAGVAGAMITSDAAAEGPALMTFERRVDGLATARPDTGNNVKTEELGKQVVEGVECIGIRTTVTISAGQIGNERALEMVTERWSSPELGFDVLRKHSDPRNGETTYKLTNIVRGEQPRALFEVPADYKLNDFSGENMRKKMTIKMREAAPENQ
ncbi:hypothetical protein [Paludibaculum fermentans]|uniref:hypothetical protein n=1 Tax=Paludibaculum fermentans TaxID=1473598 RepID=UPI003EC00816